jgi:TrmH family RNA methyltransferase
MDEPIRSFQNPRVKQAQRLRQAGGRRDSGLMVIDGQREIRQAILGGIDIQTLFVLEDAAPWWEEVGLSRDQLTAESLAELDRRVVAVTAPILEKLAYGERAETVIAVGRQPAVSLASLQPRWSPRAATPADGLVLVLDRVEKPGNLGAILRTADAVAVSAVLLSDPICEIWNPNAIRASLGAIFRLPLAVASAEQCVAWLEQQRCQILTARVDAAADYRQAQWPKRTALVVGNEAEGLGNFWRQPAFAGVRLPMQGTVDSLNVSVSTAILLYHAAASLDWLRLPESLPPRKGYGIVDL